MRVIIVAAVACLSIIGMTATAQVHAAIRKHTEIPAESLDVALRQLAKDRGFQLVYLTENVASVKTHGAVGEFTVEEALKKLLSDSHLEYKFVDDHTVSIFLKVGTTSSLTGERAGPGTHEGDGATSGNLVTAGDLGSSASGGLQEIVVTAAHRSEPLSQVGSAVSAISGDELLQRSADSLQDYVAFIPGVSLTSQGAAGYGVVAIRGIAPQGNGATVATYIDEIPVGASGATTRSAFFTADLDPEDLQRIEVLKGPQGTLYGASSMGGVLKYVTRDPNLVNTEITLSEDGNYVQHGEAGVKVRGSVSTPLIDGVLGVRASVYYRHDPGFIYDIGVQGSDVGRANDSGGRIALLFKPSDVFSIKLSAMAQENRQIGLSVVDTNTTNFEPTYGRYSQLRYEPEGLDESTRLYSAEIHYHFGVFDLLSATAYSQIKPTGYADDTLGFAAYGLGPVSPTNPAQDISRDYTDKFTQELRLTSVRLGIAEFMVGAFYQHEKDQFSFVDTLTLTPDVNFANRSGAGSLDEYAGFLDVSLYLSPKFDLTLGYRYSRIDQKQAQSSGGELYNPVDPGAVNVTSQSFSESPSTYLAAARYHVNDDLLFYARAASGYRPGGGRALPPGTPPSFSDFYTSDKLWSYEVGAKFKGLNNRLTIDADAFYIDWSNIQTQQPVPGTPFLVNGNSGTAHSRGVELQAAYVPLKGVTVGANGAYTDARFTETVPGVVNDGDRLTYVPKFAGAAYAQYLAPIQNGWNALVEGDYQYEGYRVDTYRVPLPGYGTWNTRFGVQNDRWVVNFYVKNLTDKYAREGSNGGGGGPLPYYFVINTPRTFGVSLIQHF